MSLPPTSYGRDVPVTDSADIVVVGGGPAGIAAAIAARRSGADVLLLESQGCLGGMGTAGMVPWFTGFSDGQRILAEGVWRQVRERMFEAGGFGPEGVRENDRSLLRINTETLKRVYDDMVMEAGVRCRLFTGMADTVVADGRVTHLICGSKDGLTAIAAKYVVDASGDGDVCAFSGCTYTKGDGDGAMMPATVCQIWDRIDWPAFRGCGKTQGDFIGEAIDKGMFSVPDYHLPGMVEFADSIGGGNISHTYGVDATSAKSLTDAMFDSRRRLPEYERFYNACVPGFDKARIVTSANVVGCRESRRIDCEYMLTIDDYCRKAVFEDEVGRFHYWIDQHAAQPGKANHEGHRSTAKRYTIKVGESVGIPYRSLVPKGLDNVLVAGRCVGTDRLVQSAIRVMPACFTTGQAAGVAAGVCLRSGAPAKDAPSADVIQGLLAIGAYLPNANHAGRSTAERCACFSASTGCQ